MSRRRRTKLSSRFISYFAITYLVMIGLMGVVVDTSTRSALTDDIDENLAVAARLAIQSLPDDQADYRDWAKATFDAVGYRITLIDIDGVVIADSHSDPKVMENHIDRPEMQTALTGQVGYAQRTSDSTGFEQRYVAIPPGDGLIVRTSVSTRIIDDEQWSVRRSIVIAAVALGVLGVVLMALFARHLAGPIIKLTEQARAVAEGESVVVSRRSRVDELDQLGLAISTMATRLGSRVSDAEAATATLEVVLGALPQGTVLVDGDDRVVYVNSSARDILGTIPERLANLAPIQFQNAIKKARETRGAEESVIDSGSPSRRLRGVATPFADDERVLFLVVDITERERTDSIRRDFVANASHELKTPVSTIIASSEALRIALDRHDPSAKEFAIRIEESAHQMNRLVGDLFDLSRLERESPELVPVRLDHLVRDEVQRFMGAANEKGIIIEATLTEVTAAVSQGDIAVAIRNLLDNAVRYTSGGGSIQVEVRVETAEAVISVADSGEGIPTRDSERVFERFYRVDSARSRATGGTGLGLAIVKHVAESHGGSVSLRSELGVGSKFTVRLPIGLQEERTGGH